MTHCPTCGRRIYLAASVPAWRQPPDWMAFYGDGGQERAIRCQAAGYVHFYVVVEGRESHRLAVIDQENHA